MAKRTRASRAYVVSDDESSVVVFGRTWFEAKRHGAAELGGCFEHGRDDGWLQCERAPQFDARIPPLRERVEQHGWYARCARCDATIYGGSDDEGRVAVWSDSGETAWCSDACREAYRAGYEPGDVAARAAERAAEFERLEALGIGPLWFEAPAHSSVQAFVFRRRGEARHG